jgi:hypothetical protein
LAPRPCAVFLTGVEVGDPDVQFAGSDIWGNPIHVI